MASPSPIALPRGLELIHIQEAVTWVEAQTGELVDLYYEQANVFSGIVRTYGAKALAAFSPYKRHKHPDVAQLRFPDLSLNGRVSPPPEEALESKGSIRAWAVQSHYDHPGWYIIWRYAVDPTKTLKKGTEVAIWRVDVVFLTRDDWKYEGSSAGASGGGRTHTFGLRQPAARLRDATAYRAPGVALRGGKPVLTTSKN